MQGMRASAGAGADTGSPRAGRSGGGGDAGGKRSPEEGHEQDSAFCVYRLRQFEEELSRKVAQFALLEEGMRALGETRARWLQSTCTLNERHRFFCHQKIDLCRHKAEMLKLQLDVNDAQLENTRDAWRTRQLLLATEPAATRNARRGSHAAERAAALHGLTHQEQSQGQAEGRVQSVSISLPGAGGGGGRAEEDRGGQGNAGEGDVDVLGALREAVRFRQQQLNDYQDLVRENLVALYAERSVRKQQLTESAETLQRMTEQLADVAQQRETLLRKFMHDYLVMRHNAKVTQTISREMRRKVDAERRRVEAENAALKTSMETQFERMVRMTKSEVESVTERYRVDVIEKETALREEKAALLAMRQEREDTLRELRDDADEYRSKYVELQARRKEQVHLFDTELRQLRSLIDELQERARVAMLHADHNVPRSHGRRRRPRADETYDLSARVGIAAAAVGAHVSRAAAEEDDEDVDVHYRNHRMAAKAAAQAYQESLAAGGENAVAELMDAKVYAAYDHEMAAERHALRSAADGGNRTRLSNISKKMMGHNGRQGGRRRRKSGDGHQSSRAGRGRPAPNTGTGRSAQAAALESARQANAAPIVGGATGAGGGGGGGMSVSSVSRSMHAIPEEEAEYSGELHDLNAALQSALSETAAAAQAQEEELAS